MAIQRRLKYTAAAGALAIYDVTVGSENDTPLTSPLSDISRLHFSTALDYVATIGTYSGTINLGALAANSSADVTTVIAAHGQGGIPYVEGKISISGNWVPLSGCVVVEQLAGSPSPHQSFARFLALGANDTNIVIHEHSISRSTAGYSSSSYSYVIYLTNMIVD
jgi:hypothetical protein